MIRVRYRGSNELSPGLHATAERDGRRTTVYLLDGMTAVQRRSGIGRAGRVLRLHPAGSTVPIMVLSGGAIAFLLFSTVSIHVIRPGAAGQSGAGTSPVASASPIATGEGSRGQATGQGGPGAVGNPGDPGGTGAQGELADPGGLGSGSDPRQLTQPGRGSSGRTPALAAGGGGGGTSAGSGSGGSGSNSGTSRKSSGGTTLSGGADPSQVAPRPSTPATSAPASAPASTPSATAPAQSGSGSGSSSGSQGSGVCVNVGPLGGLPEHLVPNDRGYPGSGGKQT